MLFANIDACLRWATSNKLQLNADILEANPIMAGEVELTRLATCYRWP